MGNAKLLAQIGNHLGFVAAAVAKAVVDGRDLDHAWTRRRGEQQ